MSKFFKKEEGPKDTNEYSLKNMPVPLEKHIKLKNKNVYKVLSLAEIKKQK
tara:strand:- start:411 stop:563 length:153 start_codon:yes stop_codon:yes gene_type:complete